MKINNSNFRKQFEKCYDDFYDSDSSQINMVKLSKIRGKDCYNIIVSINDIEISLMNIKHCIEKINNDCFDNKIDIGSILIEI